MSEIPACDFYKNSAFTVFIVIIMLLSTAVIYADLMPLTEAIELLKQTNNSFMASPEKQAEWAMARTEAWETLVKSGREGADLLMQELALLGPNPNSKQEFRFLAVSLLWASGGMDYIPQIMNVWQSDSRISHFQYVFPTAVNMAATHDSRVLPLLELLLDDVTGKMVAGGHYVIFAWPETMEFVWGAYGPDGLPNLQNLLHSDRIFARQSALHLLAHSYHLPALPEIRKLAREGEEFVRQAAIRSLGVFGHPDDFEFLVAGLKDPDVQSFAEALISFQDLRAAPSLFPLVYSENAATAGIALRAIRNLLTPEGLVLMKKASEDAPLPISRMLALKLLNNALGKMNYTWETFSRKNGAQQAARIVDAQIYYDTRSYYPYMDKKASAPTPDEIVSTAKACMEAHRLVADATRVLSYAASEDLVLLLQVRSAFYSRLSDECMYDLNAIEPIIKRVARQRYRENPGLSPCVGPWAISEDADR